MQILIGIFLAACVLGVALIVRDACNRRRNQIEPGEDHREDPREIQDVVDPGIFQDPRYR